MNREKLSNKSVETLSLSQCDETENRDKLTPLSDESVETKPMKSSIGKHLYESINICPMVNVLNKLLEEYERNIRRESL